MRHHKNRTTNRTKMSGGMGTFSISPTIEVVGDADVVDSEENDFETFHNHRNGEQEKMLEEVWHIRDGGDGMSVDDVRKTKGLLICRDTHGHVRMIPPEKTLGGIYARSRHVRQVRKGYSRLLFVFLHTCIYIMVLWQQMRAEEMYAIRTNVVNNMVKSPESGYQSSFDTPAEAWNWAAASIGMQFPDALCGDEKCASSEQPLLISTEGIVPTIPHGCEDDCGTYDQTTPYTLEVQAAKQANFSVCLHAAEDQPDPHHDHGPRRDETRIKCIQGDHTPISLGGVTTQYQLLLPAGKYFLRLWSKSGHIRARVSCGDMPWYTRHGTHAMVHTPCTHATVHTPWYTHRGTHSIVLSAVPVY